MILRDLLNLINQFVTNISNLYKRCNLINLRMLIEVYIKGIVSQLWKEAGWKVLRMQGKNIRNY